MANNPSLGRRWEGYRPSKGVWLWSCAGCIVATMVIGFTWGGWVTGGTATKMAADAAAGASAQLARISHRLQAKSNWCRNVIVLPANLPAADRVAA